MKEESKRWHLETLSTHNASLFNMLLYETHIVSDNLKEVEFKDKYGMEYDAIKGYFARKDRKLYFLPEDVMDKLPIKMGDKFEELRDKENVVLRPLSPIPFRINPNHTMEFRTLVDELLPFEHSKPDQWILMKIIGITGYVGKTFICIASMPNLGKSSVYDTLHSLTDKSPVFKPRSVPGVLNKINTTGNMVFDDVLEAKKEVREIMEEFSLQIAGGKSVYINGAMKSARTKDKYRCSLQSITYLYNDIICYKDPEKKYFENLFDNNKAIDDRFLKLRLEGELMESFSRDFNMVEVAEENRMYYIDIAKELLYLQVAKKQNKFKRKWKTHSILELTGRRRVVYKEISLLIDMYCNSQEEHNQFIKLLDEAVIGYKEMVSGLKEVKTEQVE